MRGWKFYTVLEVRPSESIDSLVKHDSVLAQVDLPFFEGMLCGNVNDALMQKEKNTQTQVRGYCTSQCEKHSCC